MENPDTVNIMIVGVGGQGTLLASRVIGAAASAAGLDVKVSEVHGMSQRGGSVVTYVRFGRRVHSPLVDRGTADILLSFEQLEALRWAGSVRQGGTIITNTQVIDPMPVVTGEMKYPAGILPALEKAAGSGRIIAFDAAAEALACGDIRAVNTVLLGVLCGMGLTGIGRETWDQALRDVVPAKALSVNLNAFQKGFDRGKAV